MKLESVGILINMRPMGERDCIGRIFTYDYGILCGVMRGAQVAKKNRPLVGQMGTVSWNARLDSQLGAFHWEPERNLAAPLMSDANKLSLMNCAFDLLSTLLPERERYEFLFNQTTCLLQNLNNMGYADSYLQWETGLLGELGYALDMTHCSGCGAHENLHYMSPRTGRAVCDTCAAPYIGRLYELPLCLDITYRFLDSACTSQGAQMPLSRRMLARIQQ